MATPLPINANLQDHENKESTAILQQDASEPNASAPAELETAEGEDDAAQTNSVDWQELVARIRGGDESGMEELYRVFGRGIRFYL